MVLQYNQFCHMSPLISQKKFNRYQHLPRNLMVWSKIQDTFHRTLELGDKFNNNIKSELSISSALCAREKESDAALANAREIGGTHGIWQEAKARRKMFHINKFNYSKPLGYILSEGKRGSHHILPNLTSARGAV